MKLYYSILGFFLFFTTGISQLNQISTYYILFNEKTDKHSIHKNRDEFFIQFSDQSHYFTSSSSTIDRVKNLKNIRFSTKNELSDLIESSKDTSFVIVKKSKEGNYFLYPTKLH